MDNGSRIGNRRWCGGGAALPLLWILLVSGVGGPSYADASDDIRWRGFDEPAPPARPAAEVADLLHVHLAGVTADHVILQFAQTPGPDLRGQLADAGVVLGASLGSSAFFASVETSRFDPARLAAVGSLQSMQPVRREHRLHPALRDGDAPAWSIVGERANRDQDGQPVPVVALQVLFHRDVTREEARAIVEEIGATVHRELVTINVLVVEAPLGLVETLAARHEIQWIEPPLPRFSTLNAQNRVVTQVDTLQAPPYDLDGSGVVVMIFDAGGGLESHKDFDGRLTIRDGSVVTNHATHVAGTIGGNGSSSDGTFRGMAPGVRMEAYGFEPAGEQIFLYQDPGDFESDYADGINGRGAVIGNNSIGTNVSQNMFPCEIMGDYGIMSAVIDAVARGGLGAPIRLIWANGNERESENCGNQYHTTAPPAGAKNHLTVGGLYANDNTMTLFSSWGPVDDGRLKPDVSAPGCEFGNDGGVTSTGSNGNYSVQCGTSMATPTVTGLTALLLESFRKQRPVESDPPMAMIKAMLAHTALDVFETGPDYLSGYGVVQARAAVDQIESGGFLQSEIDQGNVVVANVLVAGPASEVRVTMAWDDPPGTPNVETALVNDLDLLIIGPGGAFYPWTLDPGDPALPAVRSGPDSINNMEQVVIDDPAPGLYSIYVQGVSIPEGPQAFSLVAGPQLIKTVVSMPTPIEVIEPGVPTTVTARVQAIGEAVVPGSVSLHFSTGIGDSGTIPMSLDRDGLYQAELPASSCGSSVRIFLSAIGTISGISMFPPDPVEVLEPPIGALIPGFADDFESDQGWAVADDPSLTDGSWERGTPVGDDLVVPATDADGSGQCFLTGNTTAGDVDNGFTILVSPVMDASGPAPTLSYSRWLSNMHGEAPNQDLLSVQVSGDAGTSWLTVEVVGPDGIDAVGGWRHVTVALADLHELPLNDQFRVRFIVSDAGADPLVEAAIDDVRITRLVCEDPEIPCPADIDGDGVVGVSDLIAIILEWGFCLGGCGADINGDQRVDVEDIVQVIINWGACD